MAPEQLELRVRRIDPGVEGLDEISYGSEGDAGIDLRASGRWVVGLDTDDTREIDEPEYEIQPQERILIKTGIAVAIPPGHYSHFNDRSGHAFKAGLHVIAGVIDQHYRGEMGIVMVNTGRKSYVLKKNERVAQMIVKKYERVSIVYVDELDETDRGKGFGSSGRY